VSDYAWPLKSAHLHPKAIPSGTKTEAFEIAALITSPWFTMIKRAITAFATLVALSQTATAGVPSCAVVRFYVAKYSEGAAVTWARGHGASEAEIETARRCLHRDTVQTASSASKSQVLAPAPERAQQEPTERDPDKGALSVASTQGQRQDPDKNNHDNEPGVHDVIRAKNIEDGSARPVNYEIKDDVARPEEKTTTVRPRYAGATQRVDRPRGAGRVSWLKRLWDQLTKRRQFRFAVLHFRGGPR
jgi:hypothetical protein